MAKPGIEFDIIPIFDQPLAGVWHDFAQIEVLCDSEKYGYNPDCQGIYKDHFDNWDNFKHNFAFGAYYNNQMIGFASGYLKEAGIFYLRNLYVMPEFNGLGVGSKLLRQTETMARVFAKSLELVPLPGAISFYEQKGYKTIYNGRMSKELPCYGSGVVPVFHWIKSDAHMDVKTLVDSRILRANPNQPIYVYVTSKWTPEINAVGLRTKEGENKVWTVQNSPMSDYYRREIMSVLSKIR